MAKNYTQNLEEFIRSPGNDAGFDASRYTHDYTLSLWIGMNNVKFVGKFQSEERTYILIRVNSRSDQIRDYDVVLQFDGLDLHKASLKVFTNSLGFVYQYLYLFHQKHLLPIGLETLAWLPTEPPKVTNPRMTLGYDSTLYAALLYTKTHINEIPSIKSFKSLKGMIKQVRTLHQIESYEKPRPQKPREERKTTTTERSSNVENRGNRVLHPKSKVSKISKVRKLGSK